MQFVNPYFLFALSALAIPIIVHLFNFRRYKKVYFSNTSFLKELVEESNNAQKIKRLLILLSRCLAIIALVLAFAQPYISKQASIKKGKTIVSVFIDNSFSMQSQSTDRTLLEKAKLLAIDVANSYENDVTFQLITQELSGKQQRLLSKDDFINQVKNITSNAYSYSFDDIKKRQVDAMSIENFDIKKLYYISDFQKKMGQINADSTFEVNLVHLNSPTQNNVYIDSAWLDNPLSIIGQNNKLLIKIKNEGSEPIEKLRVSMLVNGQQKALTDNSIPAHASIMDTINFNQNTKGWNNVEISFDDFPIEFDNHYYASFYVNDAIHLLNIDATGTNKYLNALANFTAFFKTTNASINQIDYSIFGQQQLIILSNIKEVSSGLQAEIKKYVEQGGHVVFFPSKEANLISLNQFFQSLNIASFSTANTFNREVNYINTNASLMSDIFESKQQNITLPKTNYSFNTANTLSNSEKLMTYKDGQAFLTQYNIGKGRMYVFSVPLDVSICDLPINALFAPIIFKMAIDGQLTTAIQYEIGAKNNIEFSNTITPNAENMLYVVGNNLEFIPEQNSLQNNLQINVREQIVQAGTFSLISKSSKENLAYFSMNYNRSESIMDFYTKADLQNIYSNNQVKIYDGNTGTISHSVRENNDGIVLWKVCIIFALLFILLEILLIRFWKT